MKSIASLLLSFLIPAIVCSQGLYEKGYFVTKSQERYDVLIDMYNLDKNLEAVKYIESYDEKVKSIPVSDILELSVSDFKFITEQASIDTFREAGEKIEPAFESKWLFLRVEIEGFFSLYSTYLEGDEIFLFSVDNQKPQELIYKKFIRYDGKESVNTMFKKQLNSAVNCPSFGIRELSNAVYTRQNLIELVMNANTCTDNSYSVFKGMNTSFFEFLNFSVSLGSSLTSVKSVSVVQGNEIVNFSELSLPAFGIEAEFLIPPSNNTISFWARGDYLFARANEIATFLDVEQEAILRYEYINASLGLRYYLKTSNNTKIYTDLGYGKSFKIDQGILIDYSVKDDYLKTEIPGSINASLAFVFRNRYVLESRLLYLNSGLKEDENAFENVSHTAFLFNFKYLFKSYYK